MRVCKLEFRGLWEKIFLLIEFVYNKSYYDKVGKVLYEILIERKFISYICWGDLIEILVLGLYMLREIIE